MTNDEYKNAYSEVLEIIKYIPKSDFIKIPNEKIEFFEQNSNKKHYINYNPELTLDENNISKRAKAIIAILFRDYWATDSQKEIIKAKQKNDRLKIEEKKRKEYNPNNIFNNNMKEEIKDNSSQDGNELTKYKKSWIKVLANKIKCIFRK